MSAADGRPLLGLLAAPGRAAALRSFLRVLARHADVRAL
ncbi:MAG: hypothetical protein JWN46_914, partial [Acidimicrobiales bacterium]|nr:hypothetical protein [Acidimicrobiales bacterium]